jgi:4-oxalocrotonate tautomerase
MPFIEVKMLSGRSDDQKKKLVAAITDAIVDICQSPRDGTMVVIEEYESDHWAVGGQLVSERR